MALPNPETLAATAAARSIGWSASRAPAYRIVRSKLPERNRVHKAECLSFLAKPSRDHRWVMLEHEQPPLPLGPPVQLTFALEGHQGLEIVPHDPRQRQVRRRGHEVGEETGTFAGALNQY